MQKQPKIISQKIRDAARGQECTFNIPGVCNYNSETTVLCHLPDESNGMGTKSDDISAAFGCSACHDAIDGRAKSEMYKDDPEFFNRRAMIRTWRKLIEMEIITIS